LQDLQVQGEAATLEQVLAAQERRDREDANRPVGPLVPASDAVEVWTDGMTMSEVVDRLEEIVKRKVKKSETASGRYLPERQPPIPNP
jgi:cytidylate kinase